MTVTVARAASIYHLNQLARFRIENGKTGMEEVARELKRERAVYSVTTRDQLSPIDQFRTGASEIIKKKKKNK